MREAQEDTDWLNFPGKLGLAKHGHAGSSHHRSDTPSDMAMSRLPAPVTKDFRRPERGFKHLRDAGEFSDALIHVGHVTFPVHRNILSCCSPYFRALFTCELSTGDDSSRHLTDPNVDKSLPSKTQVDGLASAWTDPAMRAITPTHAPSVNGQGVVRHDTDSSIPSKTVIQHPVPALNPSYISTSDSTCRSYHSQKATDPGHSLLATTARTIATTATTATSSSPSSSSSSPSSPPSTQALSALTGSGFGGGECEGRQQNYQVGSPNAPAPAAITTSPSPSSSSHVVPHGLALPPTTTITTTPLPSRSVFSQHSRRQCRVPCYQVSLQDVAPETVDAVIEHAYGGRVTVTSANVEQLLTAADRFQVISLLKECCAFLLSELSIGNCISIVKFSSRFYACDALRKTATRFLLDNFPSVFQLSAEFERLSHQELTAILRADQLNVRHEETVLDAIIRWVLADVPGRQDLIPDLVTCVRVGLMLPENIREFVDSWLVSTNIHSEVNHVTLQVMESVLQCQKQQMTTVDGAMFSPRLPRDVLFVIGGSNFGFPLNLVEAFDCRTFSWSVICPYDFAPRSYHGMVALNKDIYVIGGFSGHVYLSSCCKLRADSLTWENVTPMNTKRCYVGAVTVRGAIYTMGGYDGVHRLNSAERFSTDTNQWSFISPMMQQRSDAGVAVLNDKVYVCGGFNGMECIRSVELYDPELDHWSAVPSMPRGRSGLGLAAHNGLLYAVGGFDGVDSAVRLAVVESYSPETCQWTELEPMVHPRSNLAVEVLEDLLYAIGGYCGDRTTSAVECYDFETNTWFESGQLSHNRSALGACVVTGLPNTADILQRNGPERCALVHLRE